MDRPTPLHPPPAAPRQLWLRAIVTLLPLVVPASARGGDVAHLFDINPGMNSSIPQRFIVFDGRLYFTALDSNGFSLWRTDGLTVELVDPDSPGSTGSAPQFLSVWGDHLYFWGSDGTHGSELWRTDGSTTELFWDFNPGVDGTSGDVLTPFAGAAYLAPDDHVHGREVWRVDGSTATLLADMTPGPFGSIPRGLVELGGQLYFSAQVPEPLGTSLWRTSGGAPEFFDPVDAGGEFGRLGSHLYFDADGPDGIELWRTDGVDVEQVEDINPGPFAHSQPRSLTPFGDWLYFSATDATAGRELWRTNGTTTEGFDLNPGPNASNPSLDPSSVTYNGHLYFAATTDANGRELWRTDGTTVERVTDVAPGAAGSAVISLAIRSGLLYFSANDGTGGEIWSTDGTSIEQVTNFASASASPNGLTTLGDLLFFNAFDPATGTELYCLGYPSSTIFADGFESGDTSAWSAVP